MRQTNPPELLAGRARYTAGQPVVDAFESYMTEIRGIPGVVAVGATAATPFFAGADGWRPSGALPMNLIRGDWASRNSEQ